MATSVSCPAGAMAAFWFGGWLTRRSLGRFQEKVDALVARFKRHGEVYIVLNRFIPGVRSFFFVAAGMAGMRARWVFLWALVSAALWSLLLIAIGSSVGSTWDELQAFLGAYSRLMWGALGVVALLLVIRWLFRRFRKPTFAKPAPIDLRHEIATQCDVVIEALAD